jgi:ABC-type sugar transport system substrate-binding protein
MLKVPLKKLKRRNEMKKVISIIVCLVIVCSLFACTGQTTASQEASPATPASSAPASSAPASSAAAEETAAAPAASDASGNEGTEIVPEGEKLENLNGKTIAACVLLEDQFQRMLQITMKKTAESYGATVLEGHSGGELDKEVELVNTYTTGGVNGICIFPVSLTGSVAALENASKNGITVYCANMNMNADWQAGYSEMDQYGIGVGVGKYAREYIEKNFPDRKPKVAIIQFTALLPEMSKQRTDGFLSQTQDLIEIVQDVDAWDSDTAVNTAADVMNANPDLDLIFCANEGGTVGTVMAVKNAGKKIPVFGIDASEQLANMLLDEDNILQAVCGQDPIALGETAMKNLCLAMMGQPYRTGVKLPGVPLTRNDPDAVNAYVENLKAVLGDDM